MKKKDVATRSEVIAIYKRLEVVLTKLDDGICAYTPGFSDQVIADECSVSISSVQGVRSEMFGKLRQGGTAAAPVGTDPRVDDLVKLAENLAKNYADLRDRHNRLVTSLSINRVIDCKHLAVAEPGKQ